MIREFWKEVREEEKERKRLKKEAKKKHLTGEQKAYKVFGVLLTIFIIFGSIFFTCKGSGDTDVDINWGDLFGISRETIDELKEPVDQNLLLPNGKISSIDYIDFETKMKNSGVDEGFFQDDGEEYEATLYYINRVMRLSDKEVGAYCNIMAKELSENGTLEILDLSIVNDNGYLLTSVAYCDLSKIINDDSLPKVYLTTVSEIRLMGSEAKLTSVGGNVHINLLDEERNDEVVSKIDSVGTLSTYVNTWIVDYIEVLKEIVNARIKLVDGGIEFIPLG